MRKRRLGRTGYEVSEIGFGAWGLGGNMWLGVDDEEGKEALRTALDLGIDFLDTALVYGEGHSEKLIGEVLRERGIGEDGGVVVATKVPPMDYDWPGKKQTPLMKTFPREWVIECVERSLRNLGFGELHLVQFHVWHDAWLEADEWPEVRDTLALLQKQGKVLHWGVSVNSHHPETAFRLLSDPLIETVQAIYNIYDRSPEQGLIDLVREKDLGFVVRVPFDEGALTGTIGPDTQFPKGDWRNRYFAGDRKREVAERADELKDLLGPEAGTLPELALRFCLQRPEVSTVIPGMRRPAHARANVAASDGRKLSPAMMERLAPFAWDKSW
jgi:aryl-alcohol dehydrogenase-like predicted oxidoreductase